MAKVLKRDVDQAHDEWARLHSRSLNADVDLAVTRAWAKWRDLRDQWEAQKAKESK